MTGYYQARVIVTGGPLTRPAMNIFNFSTSSDTGISSEAQSVAGFLHTYITDPGVSGLYPTSCTITVDPIVKFGVTGFKPSAQFTTSPGAATGGTGGTGVNLPAQAAVVVSWRTNLIGRAFRGRTYHGPLGPNVSSGNGVIGSTIIGNLNAAAANLINNSSTASLPLSILHKHSYQWTIVTGHKVGNIIDSQRRRKPKTEVYS